MKPGQALLLLFLFGSLGALAELLLLEHVDAWTQWIPVVLLALGSLGAGWTLLRGGRLPGWRALMTAFVVAGAIGVGLHLWGNLAFERELDEALTGFALWREVFMGATPALAPGSMVLLGALGWLAEGLGGQ